MKENKFEEQSLPESETGDIPEPLSGVETANLVEQVFERLPKEVAQNLVDSNVVLTMAGLKPQTEFFIEISDGQSLESVKIGIEKLNELLRKRNPDIRFSIIGEPFDSPTDEKRNQMIDVQNLLGFERASKISKLPFVIPFDRRSGWDGRKEWGGILIKRIEETQINMGEEDVKERLITLATGFMKGYPDQAITDYNDYLRNGRKKKVMKLKIPYVGLYSEAQPNYYFYPEHVDDQGIQENISAAGKILTEFYKSDWHKKVEPQLAKHKRIKD